jgi:RNA polymerase sigma-32 factor
MSGLFSRRMAKNLMMLTLEEEQALLQRAASGDSRAEARLVSAHMPLVGKVARLYARFGGSEADLVQAGSIGLLSAVRKFDPSRSSRLSTYARFWIRAAMQEQIVRGWSLVRLGKSAAHRALFFNLRRGEGALPYAEEAIHRLVERFRLPASEIFAMARRLAQGDVPLDAGMPTADAPDRTGTSLSDRLAAAQPTPEEEVAESRLQRLWSGLLDKALSMLPDREARIVRLRHLCEPAPTFEMIGRELGISKDRVRQLEQRALQRLRHVLEPQALALEFPGGPAALNSSV